MTPVSHGMLMYLFVSVFRDEMRVHVRICLSVCLRSFVSSRCIHKCTFRSIVFAFF